MVRIMTIMMVRLVKTTMMEACRQLIDDDAGDDDGDEEGNDDEEEDDEGLWLFDRPFHLWCIN